MTPKGAEEYVRARVEITEDRPTLCGSGWVIGLRFIWDRGLSMGYRRTRNIAIFAAYEFVRQREEEIRQKREEIEAVEQVIADMCDCPGADLEGTVAHLAMKRILAVLEAQLADLLTGMKETP